MERRKFTREFKLEAVRLIKERGVSYAQASQDLDVHQSQLRGWVKALESLRGNLWGNSSPCHSGQDASRRACASLVKCRKTFVARLDRAAADRCSGRRPVDPRKAWRAPSADPRRAGNSRC